VFGGARIEIGHRWRFVASKLFNDCKALPRFVPPSGAAREISSRLRPDVLGADWPFQQIVELTPGEGTVFDAGT
jgi:hypothetical protein